MDSFETSSQFVLILRNLTPQSKSLLKAAHYALKHSDSEDYLFFAITDALEDSKLELNTKSTIFQFIDVLIHESFKISQQVDSSLNYPYVHNLKNSLPKILVKVLPNSSNANLYSIYKSLRNISDSLNVNYLEYEQKFMDLSTLLTEQELENVALNIPFPDINFDELKQSSDDPILRAWHILLRKRQQSHYERLRLLKNEPLKTGDVTEEELFHIRPSRGADPLARLGEHILSKKQILARMEDDRELHKKSKESLWLVNRPNGCNTVSEDEFLNYYWNRIDKLTDAQMAEFHVAFDELNKLASSSYKDRQF